MKIFYVHHALRDMGNPPSQEDDILPLGEEDANIVAESLNDLSKKLNFKAIYTSPYLRCKKTSLIINKYIKVPIYDEPRFNEFNNVFNAVKGKALDSGEETWCECQLRIRSAIKDIVDAYNDNDTVICVTSGVNITAFISLAFGVDPSNKLPFPIVMGCSPICFDINKDAFCH